MTRLFVKLHVSQIRTCDKYERISHICDTYVRLRHSCYKYVRIRHTCDKYFRISHACIYAFITRVNAFVFVILVTNTFGFVTSLKTYYSFLSKSCNNYMRYTWRILFCKQMHVLMGISCHVKNRIHASYKIDIERKRHKSVTNIFIFCDVFVRMFRTLRKICTYCHKCDKYELRKIRFNKPYPLFWVTLLIEHTVRKKQKPSINKILLTLND